jgi:hypothetical protein
MYAGFILADYRRGFYRFTDISQVAGDMPVTGNTFRIKTV